ncbi:1,4-alpha-glucan branching enzyme [Roseiarcus fermentans]|uniref:1,4-alpha-glucan branching enzyme GlgB n=1 Tax=Roseiarcus fermentans TaxID=1473586 RepID=A0A366FBC3_9HYPH|nr:1,4-alpha-glucan branching protein GlgB [Roseiarcus fermentans]RBP11907.1 1,4-alpha-glucan branching enzyme [Roseiarcus fermentans]
MEVWRARDADIEAIHAARCDNPFAVLGPHLTSVGWAIRVFAPDAIGVRALTRDGALLAGLERRKGDFFEALIPSATERPLYRVEVETANGTSSYIDSYAFGPALGPIDDYLLREGSHRQLYRRLGAQIAMHEGVDGVLFALWAPNAARVSVVGDFNHWDGRRCQMRKRFDSGLWEIFVPHIGPGAVYKYELTGPAGNLLPLKADPFGFEAELRPSTASVVADSADFEWTDHDYMKSRGDGAPRRKPMTIYEVHLGSWKRRPDGSFLSYDELADDLIPYAAGMGYTHIELLPISEHPLDESWGYQPIGLFAPTSRFGTPAGFARFVDKAHTAGLGVIIDWVPAHFPTDEHGLAHFDGTALYEHADPRKGFHPDWNTAIYNFGRFEVANFLYCNALYWVDRFHVDGLRVDAVASMLYLDYSRREGEWLPNADGSKENREAIAFLRRANELVYGGFPGAITIAEESTAFAGVSAPTDHGGLGFGFKWNMGWMHDTLDYMSRDPIYRRWGHDKMTFGLLYAFSENFVLPISHDEVVHGKGSVIGRMPGDEWQRFANARAFYGFMWGHPGKKLLFMGQEFGQTMEWNAAESLPWWLLDHWPHQGVQALIRDLNRVYRDTPALYARDCEPEGFRWIVVNDDQQSVLAFLRRGAQSDPPVAVVCNFTPEPRMNYRIGLPFEGHWREAINTDAGLYGGSNIGNLGDVVAEPRSSHGFPCSAALNLPPLATLYLVFAPPVAGQAPA